MPGGIIMGCMGKKWLNILAGLVFIAIALNLFTLNYWLIVGLYLLIKGLLPFFCTCECCQECSMKKKK